MAVSIQQGVGVLASARFVLTAALGPATGLLSPGGVLRLLPNASNEAWEVLLRVEAAQLPLEAANDYSFLNTRQAGQGGGAVVVRYVEPNPRITASLDGQQLWGTAPTTVRNGHSSNCHKFLCFFLSNALDQCICMFLGKLVIL